MASFDDLALYVLPGCPYCARVDAFLDRHGIEIEHRDVTQGTNGDDLVRVGGKRQCPCLLIDGRPLYESGDIIAYLADRIGAADEMASGDATTGGSCTFTPGGGHVCS